MKLKYLWMGLVIAIAGCTCNAPKKDAATTASIYPKTIDEAVASSRRDAEDTKRDQYRHPVETLKFFGLKPDMTVVEIWPSGGWYTEIIAPFLAEKGHYIAANSSHPEGDDDLMKWINANKDVTSGIVMTEFNPPQKLNMAAPNSADMVVTFRNVHNWMRKNGGQAAFDEFFRVLKPGGILGVVEHRASTNKKQDPKAKSGYVREDYVIGLAKKAGFQLIGKSEINANPKDTKDYPDGVWTLPPSFRMEEKDHAKYAAIGESDRMTLKFMKPLKR